MTERPLSHPEKNLSYQEFVTAPAETETEIVPAGETVPQTRTWKDRLAAAWADPVLHQGAEAAFRTAANGAITLADTLPGFGEFASWGADAAKLYARYDYARRLVKAAQEGRPVAEVRLSRLDLTPDVRPMIAVGTEALEVLGIGAVPTHGIESALQIWQDKARLKAAYDAAKRHFA